MSTKITTEIWELTIPGRVTVNSTDYKGRPTRVTAKGKGMRLRLSTDDREENEELMSDPKLNPFRNGTLVRVNPDADHKKDANEMDDSELTNILELDGEEFEEVVGSLSELNVRRLKSIAPHANARHEQILFIDELIEKNWAPGGAMPSYEASQPQ